MYRDPPGLDLSLDTVLRSVYDRFVCLDTFDSTNNPREAVDNFLPALDNNRISEEVYYRDQSSHFLLRAICSVSDQCYEWFVSHELKLFSHKLHYESAASLSGFCKLHSLFFDKAEDRELQIHKQNLLLCQGTSSDVLEEHFKVPFTTVLDLVAQRSIYLYAGFAFVPASAIASLLKDRFFKELLLDRSRAEKAFRKMSDDERFSALIAHISGCIMKRAECTISGSFPAPFALDMSCLEETAVQSFPLCMFMYQSRVKMNMRIDYSGWLQYTGFLKDCGASVTEVMQYWTNYYQRLGR